MYRIIFFSILILLLKASFAQELHIQSAAHGIFIQLPDASHAYQSFELKKKQRSRFKKLASLNPPESKAVFMKRYREVQPLFPVPLRNETESLELVWDFISQKKPLEKLSVLRHPAVQVAMGVAWLDLEVEIDESFTYQLSGNSLPNRLTGETRFQPHAFVHEPFAVLRSSRDEDFPVAEWWAGHPGELVDYQVWRRGLGEKEFHEIFPLRQKAQQPDTFRLIMTDTTAIAEGIYEYYVIPLDILGNQGKASRRVQAGNFSSRTLPTVHRFQATSDSTSGILQLSWSLTHVDRVRSLHLYRSRQSRGGFEQIGELSPLDSMFTDHVDEPGEGYFYFLKLNDITGNDLQSITVFGIYTGRQTADAPVRVVAQPERDGIRIHWQGRGEHTRGYYVYRAEGYRGKLQQVSSFISSEESSTFLDTTDLKPGKVYSYAVKSESKSHDFSEFSERVSAISKKATSISPPLSIKSSLEGGKVRISWDNLYDREAQLDGYFVYKKEMAADSFVLASREKISFRKNFLYDQNILPGKGYQYAVQAVDIFGSKSSLSKMTEIEIPLPRLPERLGAKRTQDGVALQWNAPKTNFPYSVQIFRSEGRGKANLLTKRSPEKNNLLDDGVIKGEIYTYRLVCVDDSGKMISSTDAVSIRF